MFKNPFSFNGRIRRLEYGLSYLIYVFGSSILNLMIVESVPDEDVSTFISIVCLLPFFWILIAQGAKRCHDRGNSGWYQVIPLYFFWMIFADGELGMNEYGPNPKGLGNTDEVDEIGNYLK